MCVNQEIEIKHLEASDLPIILYSVLLYIYSRWLTHFTCGRLQESAKLRIYFKVICYIIDEIRYHELFPIKRLLFILKYVQFKIYKNYCNIGLVSRILSQKYILAK
jgi:hypothetical protein